MNAGELQVSISADISAFRDAMDSIAELLNQSVSAIQSMAGSFADGGSKVNDSGTGMVTTVAEITKNFAELTGKGSTLIGSIKGLSTVTGEFNVVLDENPIGIIITLIGNLVLLAIQCYQKFAAFRGIVNAVWVVIKALASIIADVVITEFKILLDIVNWACRLFKDLGTIVSTVVLAPFKLLVDAVQAIYYATIGHDWSKAYGAIKQFGTDAASAAEQVKDSAVDIVSDTKEMAGNVAKDFGDGYKKVTDTLSQLPAQVADTYQQAFTKDQKVDNANVGVGTLTITPEKTTLKATTTASATVAAPAAPAQSADSGNKGGASDKAVAQVKTVAEQINDITEKAKQHMAAFNGTKLNSLKEQLSGVKKLMDGMINDPAKMAAHASDFNALKAQYDAIAGKIKKITAEEKAEAEAAKQAAQMKSDAMKQSADGITTAFEAMGKAASGQKTNVLEDEAKQLGSFAEKMGAKYISMGVALEVANGGASPKGWLEITGGGLLAAAGAAMKSIKMASGGIVSGSSFVNVGEYAGASHNPEVIAPLDRLRGMMGGQHQTHSFEIQGDKLVSILQRVDNNNSFALGGA